MRILVEGTGGSAGWPQPGCRCASCLRQAAAGATRKQSTVVVDGRIRLRSIVNGDEWDTGGAWDVRSEDAGGGGHTGYARRYPGGHRPRGDGSAGGAGSRDTGGRDTGGRGWEAAGYRLVRVADREAGGAGGWDLTAPDGGRLLYPGGPGAVPAPPEGAAPYDVAFLDLLGDPAQLGWLRARRLITADTDTLVAFADHRVPSEQELARRCGFWRVRLGGDSDEVQGGRSVRKDFDLGTRRVLVLGGARSGKSERAELRVAGEPEVTYVATGPDGTGRAAGGAADGVSDGVSDGVPGGAARGEIDSEWAARVAAHRARRPAWWRTAETIDLAGVLRTARGAVLIDGIGTWLAAVMDECGAWQGGPAAQARLAARTGELAGAWRQAGAYVVAVSDETGLGVVPATQAGRLFRDELGRLNRTLAAESEETELIVAGRVLSLTE
jgi:adenosylcobinamide kinase / adenosylcobinamide-phosphate guanylyltransferase